MRTKIIAYWTVTILIALETLVGGVTDLVHGKEILVAGPPVADIVTHLGYPLYFLRIIGVWKLLGGIVLLIPGYPRLKEWAYVSGPAIKGAIMAGSSRSQWSTRESPRSTETQ